MVYTLKTPYRDGTTQVAFDPADFMSRLAALVPKRRFNLTHYHGVLAPNHRCRRLITPANRGKGGVKQVENTQVRTTAEQHAAMTWAQRLKRVFNIDIEVCGCCGGSVNVIACIEDQDVIPDKAGQALDRILTHLRDKGTGHPNPAPPGTTNQSSTGDIPDKAGQALASFRWEGSQFNSTKSARKPLRN